MLLPAFPGLLIPGNLGADTIILNGTTSVYNTEIYGSDSAGTDTAADSIVVGARTIQTSTVYGGAGADTLILGETSTAISSLKLTIRAFAGNDSVAVYWFLCEHHCSRWYWQRHDLHRGHTVSGQGSSPTCLLRR